MIAIVPQNTTKIVIKFDKPILAEIEKSSDFEANFEAKVFEKESKIVKLKAKGELKKPVIVSIKDKKNGNSVKVMVKVEDQGSADQQKKDQEKKEQDGDKKDKEKVSEKPKEQPKDQPKDVPKVENKDKETKKP